MDGTTSARSSWLIWAIAVVQPIGLTLMLAGPVRIGAVVLLSSHALWLWGTLNPHSRLFAPVLRRLAPTPAKTVWLTIDDGPSADTPALLDVLDRRGAKATFFLVAERAERQPALVRAIVERGHQVGNHTATHPAASFWIASPARVREEITRAQHTLTRLAGRAPVWFRAVAGQANPFVGPVLRRLGLRRVSWSARGFDSVDDDDARVLRRLLRGIAPGAVLLLHEGGGTPGRAARLLSSLLIELDARGYRAVVPPIGEATTSQLLNGVLPHSGRKLHSRPSAASSAAKPARVG